MSAGLLSDRTRSHVPPCPKRFDQVLAHAQRVGDNCERRVHGGGETRNLVYDHVGPSAAKGKSNGLPDPKDCAGDKPFWPLRTLFMEQADIIVSGRLSSRR